MRWNTCISIHALLAESDLDDILAGVNELLISIHALLAESDAETAHQAANGLAFLSTLSLRRATGPMERGQVYYINFYPRSPCGERPAAGRFLLS